MPPSLLSCPRFTIFRIAVIALIFNSCATEVAPTGGPEDKTPPKILKTYPDSAALRFQDNKIRLYFDKFVSSKSLEAALFFSPYIDDYEVQGGGTEATIVIYDSLKANRTYTYTVTDALQDSRNNKLEKSYTFAFSTGDRIDSGTISGRVFSHKNRPQKGALVLAYLLPTNNQAYIDTLNPGKVKPDYIAQTDSAGRFNLQYLADGDYRLIAIDDKDNNRLYDIGKEEFALPFQTVRAGARTIQMRLATEDTAQLELQAVDARNKHLVSVRFDRNVMVDSLSVASFSLFDSTAKSPVKVYDFYAQTEGGREQVFLVTDSLTETHAYGIRVSGVVDKFGIKTDSLVLDFRGSSEPDTMLCMFIPPFADSAKNVLEKFQPSPNGRLLELKFTTPIERARFQREFKLEKATGNAFQPIDFDLTFRDGRQVFVKPKEGFKLGAWYRFAVEQKNLNDARGTALKDTTFIRRFQIAPEEQFGELEGTVELDTSATLILYAELLSDGRLYPMRLSPSPIDNTGVSRVKFKFTELPEGRYFLSAFMPATPTASPFAQWDGGSPFPYRLPERFAVGFDSIRVRRRWTTTDAVLRFPKIIH